jgi:hypothetical protein
VEQLKALLEQPDKRKQIVSDCVAVIEAEVQSKTGLTGIAVKTAYGLVKAIKPGMIREAVDGLLDEFVERIEPFVSAHQQQGQGELRDYLVARSDDVAESLLGVTDSRAERSRNKTMVKAYRKLRPKGKEHVVVAIPRVGDMLQKHVAANLA